MLSKDYITGIARAHHQVAEEVYNAIKWYFYIANIHTRKNKP